MDFQHFVLTRFNVRMSFRCLDMSEFQYPGLDPSWLADRFRMFETLTLPSLRAQRAPFEWVVIFNPETPEPWRSRILDWESRGWIVPLWLNEYSLEAVVEFLKSRLRPETKWVITTRIDNDDGVDRNYLAEIQRQASGRGACFLNFADGLQCYDGKLYPYWHRSNAFISRKEPRETLSTVWSIRSHVAAKEDPTCVQVDGGRWWLQLIHGGNVSNFLGQSEWRHPMLPYLRSHPGLGRLLIGSGASAVLSEAWFATTWLAQKVLRRKPQSRRQPSQAAGQ